MSNQQHGPALFYEPMDAAKLQRLQSEHVVAWDGFKRCAEAHRKWRTVLHILVNENKTFAEAAAFVGYVLPDGDCPTVSQPGK